MSHWYKWYPVIIAVTVPLAGNEGKVTKIQRKTVCLLVVLDWGTLVVAKMSPWLQLDSTVETVRRNSEEVSDVSAADRC